jgi:hypothetical protein
LGPDDVHDLRQVVAMAFQLLRGASASFRGQVEKGVLDIPLQRGRNFLGGQDLVGVARSDQALWHAREFRPVRVLRDAQPAARLDGLRAGTPVGTRAGQDHRDRAVLLFVRQ